MGELVSLIQVKLNRAIGLIQLLPEEQFTPWSDAQIKSMVAPREWLESILSEAQMEQLETLKENLGTNAKTDAFGEETSDILLNKIVQLLGRRQQGRWVFSEAEVKLLEKFDEHRKGWAELREKCDSAEEAKELEDSDRAANFASWLMSDFF